MSRHIKQMLRGGKHQEMKEKLVIIQQKLTVLSVQAILQVFVDEWSFVLRTEKTDVDDESNWAVRKSQDEALPPACPGPPWPGTRLPSSLPAGKNSLHTKYINLIIHTVMSAAVLVLLKKWKPQLINRTENGKPIHVSSKHSKCFCFKLHVKILGSCKKLDNFNYFILFILVMKNEQADRLWLCVLQ